jgi:hypothetical protein
MLYPRRSLAFAHVLFALLDRYIRTSANIAGRGRNEGWFGYAFGYESRLLTVVGGEDKGHPTQLTDRPIVEPRPRRTTCR